MSKGENSGKKDEKMTVAVPSGFNAHTLKRAEQIQGIHEKGQCDLTEFIWTRRMRKIDIYPYLWNVSFTRTFTSLLWPQCLEQYGVHRRCIISVC